VKNLCDRAFRKVLGVAIAYDLFGCRSCKFSCLSESIFQGIAEVSRDKCSRLTYFLEEKFFVVKCISSTGTTSCLPNAKEEELADA
jgi:hypothetical protein